MQDLRAGQETIARALGVETPTGPLIVTAADVGAARIPQRGAAAVPTILGVTHGLPGVVAGYAANLGVDAANKAFKNAAARDAAMYTSGQWQLPFSLQAPGQFGKAGGLLGEEIIEDYGRRTPR